MKILILLLLLIAIPALAVEPGTYDPATGQATFTLSPQERADLKRAAKQFKTPEAELLRQTNENWLKHVRETMTKMREQNLRERYEKLTPDQRKTVDDVMGPIP